MNISASAPSPAPSRAAALPTQRTPNAAGHRPIDVAVLTAFPPGSNSLNEYGLHLATALAHSDNVGRCLILADDLPGAAPAQGRPRPEQLAEGIEVQSAWRFNSMMSMPRLVRAVRRERPDAVIVNLQFATFGDRKVPGGLGLLAPVILRRLTRTPVLVILHNLADNVDLRDAGFADSALAVRLMRTAGRALTRAVLGSTLISVTIARYVEQLRRDYGADNVYLAPHGSFVQQAIEDVSVPPGPARVLAFGKWGTYKTLDVLLAAYEQLLAQGMDDLELVIAGSDSPNAIGYLDSVAARFKHLPGLSFTGYVPEEDVEALFRSATVVAFPYTSTTGSSGVLHQAGDFGRAAVLPRVGDLIDVIEEEGFVGEYFESGDADSLAQALSKVLRDPEHRERLARTNFRAATGIPMAEIAEWHLLHLRRVGAERA